MVSEDGCGDRVFFSIFDRLSVDFSDFQSPCAVWFIRQVDFKQARLRKPITPTQEPFFEPPENHLVDRSQIAARCDTEFVPI